MKGESNIKCVDDYTVSCANVSTVHLSAQKSLAVVKSKIELDSHADTCVLNDQCLIVHNHNTPVSVEGYDSKVESKHACIVDVIVAYTEHETGQVVNFLINQAIEMKGLDHCPLCPMQCHVNGVLIDEVPTFLAPIPSETMHAIQIVNLFDVTHLTITLSQLNIVTSYFNVRKPTHHGICQALSLADKNKICLTTGDLLSALVLQQGEYYLSTLSHCMLMMLQMLQRITTMSLCWKVLSIHHQHE